MRVSLDEAALLLGSGHVVGVPTETVYGLAASLHHPQAVEAIFRLKGRPANNPLIIHLSSVDQLMPYVAQVQSGFSLLADTFWPGPMTLVLPIDELAIPSQVRAGLPTAAFRIPQHPLALSLLKLTGPLVMPSANLSGKPSATAREHVEADFGSDFPVLDGGPCARGLESTILIGMDGHWSIIRQGALAPDGFEPVLGYAPLVASKTSAAPLCPGQLYRHYAPNARLLLTEAFGDKVTGVVLGYKERLYPAGLKVIVLGSLSQPAEVAESLYRSLRQLDEQGIQEAWVDSRVPSSGLWLTILERLTKASQK